MSVRIRYKNNNGVLTSVKTFNHPDNGARFRVVVDTTALTYLITDETAEAPVAGGNAKNTHQLKIEAKNALAELGILFETEERSERTQTLTV